MGDFVVICCKYNLFETCFKNLLDDIDIIMLRSTCTTLRNFINKSILDKNSLIKFILYKGYFKILLYYINMENKDFFDMDIGRIAYSDDDENIQKQLIQYFYDKKRDTVCNSLALYGNLKLLEWAIKYGFVRSKKTFYFAAKNCHIETLKFLKQHQMIGVKTTHITGRIYYGPCKSGDLNLVKWLHQSKIEVNLYASCIAAVCGHLEIIKYLATINKLHSELYKIAFNFKKIEIIEWLKINDIKKHKLNELSKREFMKIEYDDKHITKIVEVDNLLNDYVRQQFNDKSKSQLIISKFFH